VITGAGDPGPVITADCGTARYTNPR
jgi:hypothetical protein